MLDKNTRGGNRSEHSFQKDTLEQNDMAPASSDNIHDTGNANSYFDPLWRNKWDSLTLNPATNGSNTGRNQFTSSISLPFDGSFNDAPRLNKFIHDQDRLFANSNDTTLTNNNFSNSTNCIVKDVYHEESLQSTTLTQENLTNPNHHDLTNDIRNNNKSIENKRYSINTTMDSIPYTPTSRTSMHNKTSHSNRRPSQIDRRLTFDSIQSSIPFTVSAHRSQIFPIADPNDKLGTPLEEPRKSINSTAIGSSNGTNKTFSTSTCSSSSTDSFSNNNFFDDSCSLIQSLLHSNQNATISNNVSIGHRIGEDNTNFNIVQKMLIGIKISCERIDQDMNDLRGQKPNIHKYIFDANGQLIVHDKNDKNLDISQDRNNFTNSNFNERNYSFKFKDYFGYKFSQLRQFYNINEQEYLDSLTSQSLLNELNSPGKSGSFFYFSKDYKYIIKTIHHAEHLHLRKFLNQYINHMLINRHSLICRYYGLYRIKLPTSFSKRTNIINRKIYLVVMNNVLPPLININTIFDLKGSLTGRLTLTNDGNANIGDNDNSKIVKKDLNWLNENGRILFDDEADLQEFLKQLRKDTDVLIKTNTMDYSLIVGIYNINDPDSSKQIDGMINADSRFRSYYIIKTGNIVYFLGIIDCLTNYSFIKKLETAWRSISDKFSEISAIPPRQYGDRFYSFISESSMIKKMDSDLE